MEVTSRRHFGNSWQFWKPLQQLRRILKKNFAAEYFFFLHDHPSANFIND